MAKLIEASEALKSKTKKVKGDAKTASGGCKENLKRKATDEAGSGPGKKKKV
jgi:hypothetical protein